MGRLTPGRVQTIKAAVINSLSAAGSRYRPSRDLCLSRRAARPSRKSVAAAAENTRSAARGRRAVMAHRKKGMRRIRLRLRILGRVIARLGGAEEESLMSGSATSASRG
ncbi:MAG: hypothetical protein A2V45_12160 [Candidatus Aminicenantes bacterium RBG_19FT_COMBO_58_17]|nr:MAG: hypothetical protein A2V45_12160 [Candidatus Aminicenantes bacterium RBG_19FT_COMBO_58_17]